MKIPKDQILQMLRDPNESGDASRADEAQRDLPGEVDTSDAQQRGMLEQYGIDVGTLVSRLGNELGKRFGL